MTDTSKTINVIFPSDIQRKIDDGVYRLAGFQIRDSAGRIVCNLASLEAPEENYFSPNMYLQFNGCTFISAAIVPNNLRELLDKERGRYLSVTQKIDRLLQNQTNDLAGDIANFLVLFRQLQAASKLATAQDTFRAGAACASRLAAHLPSYIEDYINSTIVYHQQSIYKGETFFDFKTQREYGPAIERSEFLCFINHQANYFAYSFLEILNDVNILSLVYDRKIYPEYLANLDGLETLLRKALQKLLHGLGQEGDIYEMCFSPMSRDQRRQTPLNANRVIKYDDKYSIEDLIARKFDRVGVIIVDENRVKSINAIFDLLADIENLRERARQIEEVDFSQTTELEDIRKVVFSET